jgi:uncharacterized integral membrane protein
VTVEEVAQVATRRSASQSDGSGTSKGGRATRRSTSASTTKAGTNKDGAATASSSSSTAAAGRRRTRASEASAAGATARARIGATRRGGRAGTRPKPKPESIAEPTVTATDDVLAASNAQKALSADMPRVAWLRTQLQNLEAQRAERLMKVGQLTLIAIIFITFVLQNAQGVNVHFLLFSLNIRLIWVIFGCGLLGGVAGYLIGRPEKSLRALLPQKEKPGRTTPGRTAGA